MQSKRISFCHCDFIHSSFCCVAPTTRPLLMQFISEDVSWVKSAEATRIQECFAVRPQIDGSLDAIRKVYLDLISEIHSTVDRYRAEWAIPNLRLNFTSSRGYHILLPVSISVSNIAETKTKSKCCVKTIIVFLGPSLSSHCRSCPWM
jgi:DNA mismatch repair ATPase MutS